MFTMASMILFEERIYWYNPLLFCYILPNFFDKVLLPNDLEVKMDSGTSEAEARRSKLTK
jgi:hypothetical protein